MYPSLALIMEQNLEQNSFYYFQNILQFLIGILKNSKAFVQQFHRYLASISKNSQIADNPSTQNQQYKNSNIIKFKIIKSKKTMQNALLGNILNNIVMEKVVRDKIVMQQKEQREEQERQRKQRQRDQFDEFDDEETKEIMRKMKGERMRMAEETPMPKIQHKRTTGQYREIMENQFLNLVTQLKHTVVHFYHKEFERCKIMDKHLKILSQQFPNTQFLYINAEKAPFFVQKLNVRTLPTLCIFIDGVMKDKVLGFDGLSGDQFLTYELAARLAQSGVIQSPKSKIKDKTIFKGQGRGGDNQSGSDNEQN